ncbi:hypothetical protein T484DRAFT_1901182 [Baffinella frigidus]|nr:hypothetical protein T484DRAFT_1901182 [Cryptophyta sp. CCMP2293]
MAFLQNKFRYSSGIGVIAGAAAAGGALVVAVGASLCVVLRRRRGNGKQARVSSPPDQSRSGAAVHPEPQPPADADAPTFDDHVPPVLAYEAVPFEPLSARGGGSSPRRVEPAALDSATEEPEGGGGPASPSRGGPKLPRQGGLYSAWADSARARNEPVGTLHLPDTAVFQEPRTANQAWAETPRLATPRGPAEHVGTRIMSENVGTPSRDTVLPRNMGARRRGGSVDGPGEVDAWEPFDIPERLTADIKGRS